MLLPVTSRSSSLLFPVCVAGPLPGLCMELTPDGHLLGHQTEVMVLTVSKSELLVLCLHLFPPQWCCLVVAILSVLSLQTESIPGTVPLASPFGSKPAPLSWQDCSHCLHGLSPSTPNLPHSLLSSQRRHGDSVASFRGDS